MTSALQTAPSRDHGGGLDAARERWGGARADWIDLSTGINPVPYPLPDFGPDVWTKLPDIGAEEALRAAARRFWAVPDTCDILAAPGASVLIALMPQIFAGRHVAIPGPTYNEHAAAFAHHGWDVTDDHADADLLVLVHPNNPDGRLTTAKEAGYRQIVIDESFADICPDQSLITQAAEPGAVVLKSLGKFWGLAGLRLGFAIGAADRIATLRTALGPWPVSGPALAVGSAALSDAGWAADTRARLAQDAARLDRLMTRADAALVGGTDLFRLYDVRNAGAFQARLATHRIWSRIFPYSPSWLRLGLPAPTDWPRLEAALSS